jgi:hypothetical protein
MDELREHATAIAPGECLELEQLDAHAVHPELSDLDCALQRTYADEYAGYRFEDHRFVAFGFTSGLWQHVYTLREKCSFAERVSGFAAEFAFVELQYCQVMLRRAYARLEAEGVSLTLVRLATEMNRVDVGVERLTEDVAQRLRSEFGEVIHVRELGSATTC